VHTVGSRYTAVWCGACIRRLAASVCQITQTEEERKKERKRHVTHLIDDSDELLLGDDDVLESGARFVKVLELPGERVDPRRMRHRLNQLAHLFVGCKEKTKQKT